MADQPAELPEEILAMTFEQALAELESVVGKLESGQVGLEESIDMYTRGALLKQHCAAKLEDAQARIEKVVVKGDKVTAEPADLS